MTMNFTLTKCFNGTWNEREGTRQRQGTNDHELYLHLPLPLPPDGGVGTRPNLRSG